jgi:hypothetical protein
LFAEQASDAANVEYKYQAYNYKHKKGPSERKFSDGLFIFGFTIHSKAKKQAYCPAFQTRGSFKKTNLPGLARAAFFQEALPRFFRQALCAFLLQTRPHMALSTASNTAKPKPNTQAKYHISLSFLLAFQTALV